MKIISRIFAGNGQIDFEEFLLLAKYYEKPLSEEQEIREMFNLIDKDRSGYIDVEELKETFISLGIPLNDKDIKQMLKEAKVEGTRLFYEGTQRFSVVLNGVPEGGRHQQGSAARESFFPRIIIIIIWFSDTVTMSHLTKCNTNSNVRDMST